MTCQILNEGHIAGYSFFPQNIQFSFIPRKFNGIADYLAKRARMMKSSEFWSESYSGWFVNLVEIDRVAIVHVA